jgi:UDP-3-O-[3-hydroxymyristoyl] glucosamine N-acyltransferase
MPPSQTITDLSVNTVEFFELFEPLKNYIISSSGDTKTKVSAPTPADQYTQNSIGLAFEKSALITLLQSNARALIVSDALSGSPELKEFQGPYIIVKNSRMAMAATLHFFKKLNAPASKPEIHPTALIHPTAKISDNVYIGPYCVIAARANIKENVKLKSHVFIGEDVQIGNNSTLHSFVSIGDNCLIGTDCEFFSHVSIGSDGFGYIPTLDAPQKIPQIGRVTIGDRVELGSHCSVDRATMGSTTISSDCKFDNFVHIGHNSQIGPNSVIAAGCFVAGSSKIGRNFMSGGGTLVADHVNITDYVQLGGRSGVTNDIPLKGAYGGYPIQPMKEYLKTTVLVGKLSEMYQKIQKLSKKLEI